MGINDELEKVYRLKWDELINNGYKMIDKILNDNSDCKSSFNEIDNEEIKRNKKLKNIPSNPLLLKVDENEIDNADIKVMFFGQETLGWHRFGTSLAEEMDSYEKYYYHGKKTNKFWSHGIEFFKKSLSEFYRKEDKSVAYIWNNISKMGRYQNKVGVPKNIKDLEREHFHSIIKEEVKIINPDIIIFLTGNRNNDIKFNFGNVKFEDIHYDATLKSKNGKRNFKKAQKIILEDFSHIKCVKLYHPSYFGGFNNIKDDALKLIKDAYSL